MTKTRSGALSSLLDLQLLRLILLLGMPQATATFVLFCPRKCDNPIDKWHFEAIAAWAAVKWDNGASTAIHADDEGKRWERVK